MCCLTATIDCSVTYNNSDTAKRTINCPGNGPHGRTNSTHQTAAGRKMDGHINLFFFFLSHCTNIPLLWSGSLRALSVAPVCDECWSQWMYEWTGKTRRCRGSIPRPEKKKKKKQQITSEYTSRRGFIGTKHHCFPKGIRLAETSTTQTPKGSKKKKDMIMG